MLTILHPTGVSVAVFVAKIDLCGNRLPSSTPTRLGGIKMWREAGQRPRGVPTGNVIGLA